MTEPHRSEQGFSFLELMVSTVVMLIVAGGAFSALNYYQKTYQHTEIGADMHDNLRSAVDLIIQEVGQAGALPSGALGSRKLIGAAFASGVAQTVNVNSGAGFFPGEKLLVDAGANQELVTLTGATASTITGIFAQSHNNNTQINLIGVFPGGIIAPNAAVNPSTATKLKLFGDINGDGTLVYVEYTCNYAAGTFTRSVTPVGAGAVNAANVLVDNLLPN